VPSCPLVLEALCLRLLARDPADRPGSADEVAAEVEAFLDGVRERERRREEARRLAVLAEDPARRYDSARALAADLRRWLDGEPVEAQRASALYRLRKRAARHPRIVAASVLAALLIAALAGTALRTRWEATARADAARRFGTAAKEMESLLRVAELVPRPLGLSAVAAVFDRRRHLGGESIGGERVGALVGLVHPASVP
jgi:hypothetical protein